MKRTSIVIGLFILLQGLALAADPADVVSSDRVVKAYRPGKTYPTLSVTYPKEGTIFPPDIAAPTFKWNPGKSRADVWVIMIQFPGENSPLVFQSGAPTWTPEDKDWGVIKTRSREKWAAVTLLAVASAAPDTILQKGTVKILTSKDEVGDSLLYREVNLPFSEAVKDPSLISWRFGSVASKTQPPVILTGLPVCGNCHSVSRDGKVLGMDVDYANDKGAYIIAGISNDIVLSRDKIISWNDFKKDEKEKTFGLLSQVSPDGRYILSTVKDRSVFIPIDNLPFSQLFFPIKGILAFYDRARKTFQALPGADDKRYVQSNPTWNPDGKSVVFARSDVFILKNMANPESVLLTQADFERFIKEKPTFLFDLYRIPFNEGRGGTAEPIRGASDPRFSEYFAKFSPDGKWIVFCRAKSFMLLQPDSELYIIKAEGGTPRRMNCNTDRMNSWHSFSSNGRWLVFASKANTPYTQLFLTHIDESGMDSPAVVLDRFTSSNRAANIPEFVNLKPDAIRAMTERFLNDQNFLRAALEFRGASDYKNAELSYRKALSLNPNNLDARHDLGISLLMQSRIEEAIAQFKEVLVRDPKFLIAYDSLAATYQGLGKYDEALLYARKALDLNPKDEDALNIVAIVYSVQGRMDESIETFKTIIKINPKNMSAYFNLGMVYRVMKRWDDALQAYFQAEKIAPRNAAVKNGIGVIYSDLGRYREAFDYFNQALTIDPKLEDAKTNLESVKKHLKK